MRKIITKVLFGVSLAGLLGLASAGAAEAATVTAICPDPAGGGNYVELTYDDADGSISCADFGDGNTFPNASDDPLQFGGVDYAYRDDCPDGCTDVSSTGDRSGTWSILSGAGDYLLLFKFGQGQTEPDWFLFLVQGVTGGEWDLLPAGTGNALSHVALWGDPGDPPPVIPEPATLLLFGSGLAGVAAAAKRRALKA